MRMLLVGDGVVRLWSKGVLLVVTGIFCMSISNILVVRFYFYFSLLSILF